MRKRPYLAGRGLGVVRVALTCRVETWVRRCSFRLAGRAVNGGRQNIVALAVPRQESRIAEKRGIQSRRRMSAEVSIAYHDSITSERGDITEV